MIGNNYNGMLNIDEGEKIEKLEGVDNYFIVLTNFGRLLEIRKGLKTDKWEWSVMYIGKKDEE